MKRSLSRVAVAIVLSALLVVGAVLPAAADGPVYRARSVHPTATIYGVCDFPFVFSVVDMNKTDTVWFRDGTWIAHHSGGGVFTYSNPATDVTLTLRLHGLITEFSYPNGSYTLTFTGNHVIPPFGVMSQGRGQIKLGPGGVFVSASLTGHNESLCEALGG